MTRHSTLFPPPFYLGFVRQDAVMEQADLRLTGRIAATQRAPRAYCLLCSTIPGSDQGAFSPSVTYTCDLRSRKTWQGLSATAWIRSMKFRVVQRIYSHQIGLLYNPELWFLEL